MALGRERGVGVHDDVQIGALFGALGGGTIDLGRLGADAERVREAVAAMASLWELEPDMDVAPAEVFSAAWDRWDRAP